MAPKKSKPITVDDLTELRLLEMGAENYKRVKLVRIRPKGSLTTISGRNGQGKTSTLEAFTSLFEGKAGVAKLPIRAGETEATSYAILGRDGEPMVTISQRFWNKKSKETGEDTGEIGREIIVEGADGREFKQPQTLATAMFAPIAFDPFAQFLRKTEKERVDLLKSLVKGFDFAANDKAVADLRTERTNVGRDFDRMKAAAASIDVPDDTPAEQIDEAELVETLAGIAMFNVDIDTRAARRRDTAVARDTLADEIEIMEAKLGAARKQLAETTARLEGAAPLPEKKDVDVVRAQIDAARTTNQNVALRVERETRAAEAKALSKEYDDATAAIDKLLAAKRKAVADAKLPVEGLEFDDTGVTLKGVPFADASSAEQLRAAALLAMAISPDLHVLVIREGSLLDPDQLEMLAALATEKKFDLLVERVTDGSGVGIIIEDGEVV